MDFWRVNSYGYPNPFVAAPNAERAWETLQSFYQHQSYRGLKDYWESGHGPRVIDRHTTESWKAAFEEYGLLYVLSRTDDIRITPGGQQLFEAAEAGHEQGFAWIALNLLLRYPLRGPRRVRGPRYAESDLLLYWFVYAALRELGNYVWWTEVERVLCTVFMRSEAGRALETVRRLRSGELEPERLPLPARQRRGAFYNALNQVFVHASLNYLVFGTTNDDSFYDAGVSERRHLIKSEWLSLVDLALGAQSSTTDCDATNGFVERMPRAPDFSGDEEAYFDYLGAEVPRISAISTSGEIHEMPFGSGTVAVLQANRHYRVAGHDLIVGPVSILCHLARGQRVIVEHDLEWTYIVLEKTRQTGTDVAVRLRRGRPISDSGPVRSFLEASGERRIGE